MKNFFKKLTSIEQRFWQKRRSNVNPSIFQHDYLTLLSLLNDIKDGIKIIQKKSKKQKLSIIDIGCGEKPYRHLFSPFAKKYIGVDISPDADIKAPAEKLPFSDRSFDLALHFQVFEHLENPEKSVEEMKRVLKKGGFVLASAPGIWQYHPAPRDYHRWTGEGLKKLFYEFSSVSIKPNLKSYTTIIQIINIELYSLACRNFLLKIPLYIIITVLNIAGKIMIPYGQNHLSINYVIVAKA